MLLRLYKNDNAQIEELQRGVKQLKTNETTNMNETERKENSQKVFNFFFTLALASTWAPFLRSILIISV